MRLKFIYTGILVRDMDRAIRFYRNLLGMKLLFRSRIRETGGEVAWLKSKNSSQILELNWYGSRRWYGPDKLDHLAFEVDNADKTYRQLIRRGVKSAMKPFDEGRWRLAFVKDPDGAWIEIGSRERRTRKKRS
jgi:lactoylglutathione lyase